ncbi:Phospholipase/carboxylesterase [Xylariaceae sp. FL0804]|nr:Phospholipase/carboxylesterase [Xylariaceae sp. FL0804]
MATTNFTRGPVPGHPHTHTIIFLHGRDSEASEFAEELFESESSGPENQDRTLAALFPSIRWVFPSAGMIQSERFGTPMSQWFDMWSVENPEERKEIQQQGLRNSISALTGLINEELALVPREKIFLAGISQGFATALAAFLANGQVLAGLIGFCSWLPMASTVEDIIQARGSNMFTALRQLYADPGANVPEQDQAFSKVPFLIEHSRDDDIVPLENGKRMKTAMEALGFKVDWHEYSEGGHWVNEPAGVDDLVSFIRSNLR